MSMEREYIQVPVDYIKELNSYNAAIVLDYIRKRMYHSSGLLINHLVCIPLEEIVKETHLSENVVKINLIRLEQERYIDIASDGTGISSTTLYSFRFGSI